MNTTPRSFLHDTVRPALVLLLLLSVLTGVIYPLAVTAVAQLLMPRAAGGSLVMRGGQAVGSGLIGQSFTDPGHLWSRPSATMPQPYNATASGGSNLGPLNPALAEAIRSRIAALQAADPGNRTPVPVDLVTASASGLDPHISVAAAEYQAARVARARGLAPERVQALIAAHTEGRLLGFLGEPRINVLELNLALDATE
jgi:K+-transporting ATPase ATPase C chain